MTSRKASDPRRQLLRRIRKLMAVAARHQEDHQCDLCCYYKQPGRAREAVGLLDELAVLISRETR